MTEKLKKLWPADGHLNEAQADFLITLLTKLKPKNCLEIGFGTGRSALVVLETAKPKKLVSIDISVVAPNLPYLNFTGVQGASHKVLNSEFFAEYFPTSGLIDFAFIDGGHTYKEAYSDLKNCFENLKSGGIIVVDDYYSCDPDGYPLPDVNRAVDTYLAETPQAVLVEKWHCNGKGLAVISKTETA